MLDLNDMQKPLVAVLALGAAATAGFVAGYLVGRDPETARKLVGSVAGGLTRAQVAFAEAVENLGDLWADARADARRDIEEERFAAESVPAAGAQEIAPEAGPVVVERAAAAARPPRRKAKIRRRTAQGPRPARSESRAAKTAV